MWIPLGARKNYHAVLALRSKPGARTNDSNPFNFMRLRTFGVGENRIPFIFNRFRTLDGKTPGVGGAASVAPARMIPRGAPTWSEWVSKRPPLSVAARRLLC